MFCDGTSPSGRSSAWLERTVRVREVGGSNPLAPIDLKSRRILDLGYLPASGSAAWKSGRSSTGTTSGQKDVLPVSARTQVPKYRHYKPKDLAVVRIAGRDHYLGKYGSEESKQKYRRLLAELLSAPEPAHAPPPPPATATPASPARCGRPHAGYGSTSSSAPDLRGSGAPKNPKPGRRQRASMGTSLGRFRASST